MKATLGRIVISKGLVSNGHDEHPAIINRVSSEGIGPYGSDCVNVTVFPDCGAPEHRTSMFLFADRASADKYRDECMQLNPASKPFVLFWPDRV